MLRMKVWLVVALAAAVVVPAVADDGNVTNEEQVEEAREENVEKQVRRIQIRKVVECGDGEDCEKRSNRMVFVGEDGDVRVLRGDGAEWTSEDDVHVLGADSHDVVLIDADGEVGESLRHRLHRVLERVGEHGDRMLPGRHHGGAFLGIQLSDLTPELRTHFGVPEDAGVMVAKVVDDSPAFRAGVQVGDVVAAVDGEAVGRASELARAVGGREDGDTVVLEVWREGLMQKISAKLEERELQRRVVVAESEAGEHEERFVEIKVDCADGEDCTVDVDRLHAFDFSASACADGAECTVDVECTDGGCACTLNGEPADCSALPGLRP